MNILFVCTGNTCRSPMAEGYLKSKNIPDLNVLSRGLAADGSPVSENSAKAMAEKGIDISNHISKQLNLEDIEAADKIICLSPSHKAMLEGVVKQKAKLSVLGNGISDPFGGDLEIYRRCRDEIFYNIDKMLEGYSSQPFKTVLAERQHIKQIAKLEALCFSEAWSYECLLESYGHGTKFFVCTKDDEVLGYVGLNTVLDEGYITNVAVFPEWRKKGVATLILKKVFEFAESSKLSFVSLEVRVSNSAAIALYEKLGFLVEGRRRNFYRAPQEDAYIMTKRFDKNEDISN